MRGFDDHPELPERGRAGLQSAAPESCDKDSAHLKDAGAGKMDAAEGKKKDTKNAAAAGPVAGPACSSEGSPSGSPAGNSLEELYREGLLVLSGMPDAETDAQILLEDATGTSLETRLVYPDRIVDEKKAKLYRHYLEKRKARVPTAYITGHQGFMGLDFLVTPDVLIPEQDTETLVEMALELIKKRCLQGAGSMASGYPSERAKKEGEKGDSAAEKEGAAKAEDAAAFRHFPVSILDLCTGSGCILLSILFYTEKMHIRVFGKGTDLSEKALEVAKENQKRLHLEKSAEFVWGDLFQALKKGKGPSEGPSDSVQEDASYGAGTDSEAAASPKESCGCGKEEPERFDLIVSNPPYIANAVIETLAPEVRCSEPRMALSGGADGLDFYRRIAKESREYLKKDGILLLEIGCDQGESVPAILCACGYRDIRVQKDLGGNDRVVIAAAPETAL